MAVLKSTQSKLLSKVKVKFRVTLRLTVSRPVCLGVRHPSGIREYVLRHFKLSLDSCGFVDVGFLL
jgi:hypothetical protein